MVRLICLDCAHSVDAPLVERVTYNKEIGEERSEFSYGSGCESCAHTGYQGRTGIFEILQMSDDMRIMVLNGTTVNQLRTQAIKEGMIPLTRDGMLKVRTGVTTPSEVLRNAYSVD